MSVKASNNKKLSHLKRKLLGFNLTDGLIYKIFVYVLLISISYVFLYPLIKMISNYSENFGDILITLFDNFSMILWFTGIPIILFINGLQKINRQLYEAAQIDGAT